MKRSTKSLCSLLGGIALAACDRPSPQNPQVTAAPPAPAQTVTATTPGTTTVVPVPVPYNTNQK
jgi:hypothetical protein